MSTCLGVLQPCLRIDIRWTNLSMNTTLPQKKHLISNFQHLEISGPTSANAHLHQTTPPPFSEKLPTKPTPNDFFSKRRLRYLRPTSQCCLRFIKVTQNCPVQCAITSLPIGGRRVNGGTAISTLPPWSGWQPVACSLWGWSTILLGVFPLKARGFRVFFLWPR